MTDVVFDSSVVLAIILREKGCETIPFFSFPVLVSAVNIAEIRSRLVDQRYATDDVSRMMTMVNIQAIEFDEETAVLTSELRRETRRYGLSLGDRACLALALQRKAVVYTADRVWEKLDVPLDIRVIREEAEMYDVNRLKTVEECRTVMARAQEKGMPEVYSAALRRSCEIAGRDQDDMNDPMIVEGYRAVFAYEQTLYEKHKKNQKAGYTRRKINEKGMYQCLLDWALSPHETAGFRALVEAGLVDLMAEYVVVKYADRFPSEAVQNARQRLEKHSIKLPKI